MAAKKKMRNWSIEVDFKAFTVGNFGTNWRKKEAFLQEAAGAA